MLLKTSKLEIEIGRVGFFIRLGRSLQAHWSPDLGLAWDGPGVLRRAAS
jgi:hypothetical protein